MLPKYIFIGPTKTGTSWVDIYLRRRSEVVLPKTMKETFFFDKRFDRGIQWYERQFEDHGSRICVEVAPTYFAKSAARERICRVIEGVNVICTLREPRDRAISHYFHYLKCGEEDVGFERMYRKHPDLIDSGQYVKNISAWQKFLGKESVHLLKYSEMNRNIDAFCGSICEILDIPKIPPEITLTIKRVNEAGIPRHRHLARIARSGADRLRGFGAGPLVDKFRPMRRAIFGSNSVDQRRAEITEQAKKFDEIFEKERIDLRSAFGVAL